MINKVQSDSARWKNILANRGKINKCTKLGAEKSCEWRRDHGSSISMKNIYRILERWGKQIAMGMVFGHAQCLKWYWHCGD